MPIKRDRIDNLRVAAPCPMLWGEMRGDDRTRFCEHCNLHVYNISEMTRRQAEKLIVSTEGRFCARLYKRADGTVITKDCPVGLRAIRRRAAKVAGAAVTALFSLCISVWGQSSSQTDRSRASGEAVKTQQIDDKQTQVNTGQLTGEVRDSNGAVVTGASVMLINDSTKQQRETTTNDEGVYQFSSLEAGSYTLVVSATGFNVSTMQHVQVRGGVANDASVQMSAMTGTTVWVGLIAEDNFGYSDTTLGNKTSFTPKQVTQLPIP